MEEEEQFQQINQEEASSASTTETQAPKSNKKSSSSFIRIWKVIWKSIRDLAQIKDDTDIEATISSISKSVEFRGVNVWILAFATIVASVGLNVNSTAVIIGAMLISPLMGPINGIGLAIGTMDEDLLRKALKNLGIMVLISLIASTVYFLLSPLSDAQSELLARTRPTIYDVLIAFFGGLAGIVATSRKSQPFTVISGVAIATALMPPLCTAGFGLASGQFNYFFGAFYLFFINSFFISLSTFIMVRYLDFPQKKYLDTKRHRRVKQLLTIFTIIVLVPSIIMAIDVVRETAFNSSAIKYVNDIQKSNTFKDVQLISSSREYHNDAQTIAISLVGKPLSNSQIKDLQEILHTQYGLSHAKLIVRQTGETIDITQQNEIIEKIIDKKDQTITSQDSMITVLKSQMSNLKYNESLTAQVAKEVAAQYPDIKQFAISEMECYDPKTLQHRTMPIIFLQWKSSVDHSADEQKLTKWLKVRLNVKELKVIH